jgi:hypothetical protein
MNYDDVLNNAIDTSIDLGKKLYKPISPIDAFIATVDNDNGKKRYREDRDSYNAIVLKNLKGSILAHYEFGDINKIGVKDEVL